MDFLQYTLEGHLRNLRLKLTGKQLLVQGSCSKCGKCCQKINLQTGFTWLKSIKKLRRLRQKDPRYRRFKLMGRTDDGLLTFSCRSMKGGICTTYDTRFNFCKTYPEPVVFLMGGIFQKDCGYSLAEGKKFETHFTKALSRANKDTITRNEYGDLIIPQHSNRSILSKLNFLSFKRKAT